MNAVPAAAAAVSASKKSTTKKSTTKKSTSKRSTPKPTSVKKASIKNASIKKTGSTRANGKKPTAAQAPAKKPGNKKSATKPSPAAVTVSPSADPAASSFPVPDPPQIPRSWPNAPVRRGLGVALLGLAGAGRFTSGATPLAGPGTELPAEPVMDVALGAVDLALEAAERVSTGVRDYVNPLLARAWGPAADTMGGVAGSGLRILAGATEPLAARGRRLRSDAEHEAAEAVAAVLPETIQLVMEQLDLTGMAIDHVDLARVLDATADSVDLTGFAIDHMDLERLIEASVDQIDFTGLAISKLDFARAVTAAMEQVDVYTVAREQMDPARVAQYLRENVDVAEALRAAPTAVAGEAVRGVRDTVGRLTGRR
mgnify:CR=1 FL=1